MGMGRGRQKVLLERMEVEGKDFDQQLGEDSTVERRTSDELPDHAALAAEDSKGAAL